MSVNNRASHSPPPESYGHPAAWDSAIRPEPLHSTFAHQAKRQPNAAMIDFLGRRFTYAQLHEEARSFALGLTARGIAKGDRVGLFLPNVPTYVSAYYGAMMAGAVVVNFSPLYAARELAAQVADSGTRMLITLDVPALLPAAIEVLDGSSLEYLAVARLADALPRWKRIALRTFGRGKLTPLAGRRDVAAWGDWLSDKPSELPQVATSDLALLQYTGGTTGAPKGAMLTHANLSSNAQQVDMIDSFERDAADIVLGALPLFHVFANTCVLNRTMIRGGCIAMVPRFDPAQVLATITRTRPAAFPGVPTMFQALLDHADFAKADWSSLKICISGGAPMPAPLQQKFEAATGVRLVEGYGLTETSGVVSVNPYQGSRKPGTIGQPVPATEVMLLDKENPDRLPLDGEPGELVVRGPQIMQGYWNRPDEAQNAFARHDGERWLRTGDVATIDNEGFLTIVDRIKDMIAVGGFKVFPSQIEDVLLTHPGVKEVLVLGVPDAYLGEVPRAYVTLGGDGVASGPDLRDWLNTRVGKHERVDEVVIRTALPKTMIGKLDRKALRAEIGAAT